MIDLEFVESLIRALDESSLDSLELERGGTRIRLSKSPAPCSPSEGQAVTQIQTGEDSAPAQPPQAVTGSPAPAEDAVEAPRGKFIEITSPMVGTFYRAPAPDAASYVEVGGRIGEGTVLCIIEAMKLMNELESEVSGTVVEVMVENAEPVEFGQVLFLVDPS